MLRELPADALLAGDSANPRVAQAAESLAAADGVIVGSPVYKAAYSGLLKAFLDLLPQFALERKVVLPLATGGSPAHVLAIDYAFRPVLTSLGAEHVVQGYFLLDKLIERTDNGVIIDPSAEGPLLSVVDAFSEQLHRRERLALVS